MNVGFSTDARGRHGLKYAILHVLVFTFTSRLREMSKIRMTLSTMIAVALILGLTACSTVKDEPAPAAPAPVVLEPKPDRG